MPRHLTEPGQREGSTAGTIECVLSERSESNGAAAKANGESGG